MMVMRSRSAYIIVGLAAGLVFDAAVALAWTGPTASAPNNNVDAPINVGSSAQVKNGDLGVNNLTAFGNVQLDSAFNTPAGTPSYLNFSNSASPTWGSGGYGLRLNGSGRLEYNDSGTAGTWTGFSSSASQWVNGTGGAIYYNGGNVGIGTATPGASTALNVSGRGLFTGGSYDPGDGTASGVGISYDTATNVGHIESVQTGVTGRPLEIQHYGNLGIGTASPGAKVQVSSGNSPALLLGPNASWGQYLEVGGWRSGNYASVMASDGNLHIDSMTGHILYLNYFSGGNISLGVGGGAVGINTASPGYKLDVRANVSGNYAAGFINSGTHGAVAQGSQYGFVGYNMGGGGVGVLGQANCGNGACYGVQGLAGSYYGALGRADGYSYVGSGIMYNSGTIYGTSFMYLSDARLKHNVQNLDDGILTLLKLRPVTFTWNTRIKGADGGVDPRSGKDDTGFIAQEVEKIIPGAINTDPSTGYKSIDYPRLVPYLVKAVQQQETTIESQQAKIDDLEARIATLEARVSR